MVFLTDVIIASAADSFASLQQKRWKYRFYIITFGSPCLPVVCDEHAQWLKAICVVLQ